jgi:hypothetical protein
MLSSTTLIGELTATPCAQPTVIDDSVAALINERIRPPEPVTAGRVHVRSVRLISDAVNDHGGRFPAEEHAQLCELIVDSPVLIGHDRTRMPVARNFAARIHDDGDRRWVTVWFYWMRSTDGDRLAADIDGGIVKEGSIGFEFRTPRCSVCGHDIRRCEHVPGEEHVTAAGDRQTIHYEYRDIVRVLETSLVYRGATPDTRLGNERVFCKTESTADEAHAIPPVRESGLPRLALVLDRTRLRDGLSEYLVAQRDPADAGVCGESAIITTGRFEVGDLLARTRGRWIRIGTLRLTSDVQSATGQ